MWWWSECQPSMEKFAMAYIRKFAGASRQYRPTSLRLLFIAEAPPPLESGRFFYFPAVTSRDTLFLEMMKVLYPADISFVEHDDYRASTFDAKSLRKRKREFLERFKQDGFYLIDASEQPMPKDANTTLKKQIIRRALP
jgi:hypothetical protein